jgi:hypothetical protein
MSEEWTSEATQQALPDAKFRQDLHRALEQTHRQQMAQRQLGTRPGVTPATTRSRLKWVVILFLLLLALAAVYASARRAKVGTHRPAGS